ncbi:hypothetical protein FACS1894158_04460 [Betaproteobacteria bacterium]|nr:hypothetical protein FACS1894158_04460 [Betaproteobacteria bacterium]
MITIQSSTLSQTAETLKSRNAPAAAGGQLPTETPLALKAEDKKAEEQQSSFKVSLSDFGKRQLQALQMLKSDNSVSDARKTSARMRAAQLKQQLEGMKKIAAMFGPAAAKSVLRQIKQIARELRQIAEELGEPAPAISTGGDSQADVAGATAGGDAEASDVSGSEDSGDSEDSEISEVPEDSVEAEKAGTEDTEEAEQALAGAAEKAATAAEKEVEAQESQESEQNKGVNSNAGIDSERRARGAQMREDAMLLRDLANDVRFLLSLAKNALRKDKEDKENLKEVEKQLQETEKLVTDMEASAASDINGGDIDIGNIASETLSAVDASTAVSDVGAIDTSLASISVYA